MPRQSAARRLTGWTSNLLVTGIVLVAALGVGRQLSQWWRANPESVVTPANPGAIGAEGEQPFALEFGHGYSLKRLEVPGDSAAALQRLQAECREIAEHGPWPAKPPTEAEQRFLARTKDRPPLEERAGKWQIHHFDGKLPLLVALRLDGTDSRVVAWGLAVPSDEEACTLLVYEAGGAASGSLPPDEISLPPRLRRTLTLRGPQETTIGLAGAMTARTCTAELDDSLAAQGWTSAGWRQSSATWHNRYHSSKQGGRIDVQLSGDRTGVVGLLIVRHLKLSPIPSP